MKRINLKNRKATTSYNYNNYEAPGGTKFHAVDLFSRDVIESFLDKESCKSYCDLLKMEDPKDPKTWASKYAVMAEEIGNHVLKLILYI